MRVKQIEVKTVNPKKFKIDHNYGDIYEFPFDPVDQSGMRLGRIEWHLEPFIKYDRTEKRYYIYKLWVWATQTVDPRYKSKIFEIECYTEGLHGNPIDKNSENKIEEPFIQRVWDFKPYSDNGNYVLTAYPRDEHNVLKIAVNSSIYIEPKFIVRGRIKYETV